ncbi:MAG: cysteine hydrolase [Burkholderiales bacterium]|nr:cysteine hydrolase [Burkholderiales bacterium]
MNPALIIIDIQNDYFPGGRMELEGSPEAGLQAAKLLEAFRARGLPLVHVQHISNRPGAGFFLPDTEGVNIHAEVAPRPGETVVQKNFPNSFRGTALLEHLRALGVDHLVIAGMMTHMCVDATTRAAFDLGFSCSLAHDACATRAIAFGEQRVPAAQVHAAFLAALNGLYAKVQSAAALAAQTAP